MLTRTTSLLSIFALCASGALHAAEGGATREQAQAMVKSGIALIKKAGAAAAYTEFNKRGGPYTDRDLYLVVYGLDGVVRAHGSNAKMIGKNLLDLKDIDGKAFVKERVELGKTKPSFWQEYKFTNPENKKVEPKQMYCERESDTVVCGGIYL